MPSKKQTKGEGGERAAGRASSAVLMACAAMSHHISIEGWNPPRTSPENVLELTLGEAGVSELEEFREMLKTLVPEESAAEIDNVEITSGTVVGALIDAIAARL